MSETFKYLIIGFGPSGLSVLDQLLLCGVPGNQIAILGIKSSTKDSDVFFTNKSGSSQKSPKKWEGQKDIGYKKKGVDTTQLRQTKVSLANYWGASHLPPVYCGTQYSEFFPERNIRAAIFANARMMKLQGEVTPKLKEEFEILGEEEGKIHRKTEAYKWVENIKTDFIHSRLSIGGHRSSDSICSNAGLCFDHCPSGAFWSPQTELIQILIRHPGIRVINDVVSQIDVTNKSIRANDSGKIFFENLFLCAGPKNSIAILRASGISEQKIDFLHTPVVMQPVLLPKISIKDFEGTHVLADMLFPILREKRVNSMAQIYLPTDNLATQILTKVPKPISLLMDLAPKSVIKLLFRKVGVSMFFLENQKYGESKKTILQKLELSNVELEKQLKLVGARLLKQIKIFALDGESHHTGSIFLENNETSRGLESAIFLDLKAHGIFLADGLAMVEIPPGPHTNTVCMIARCLTMEAVRECE